MIDPTHSKTRFKGDFINSDCSGFVEIAERKEFLGCGGLDLNQRPLGYEND